MVHYGKHIIDSQTGLCEICDRGAIHDLRRGKRTGKQFLYSNQDGKFTYRPNDDDGQNYQYDTTPRSSRKAPVPSRTQPPYYDDSPPAAPKRSTRRDYTPPPEYDESPRHPSRPKVFYEVDDEGQMYPRSRGPPDEPRRRYMTQTRPQPIPTRRVQTPPPQPVSTTRPKRQVNSDTEIVERRYRPRHVDESPELTRRAEMYHIDAKPSRYQTINRIEEATPRRHPQLEPIERKAPVHREREVEPVVERKVYRKLPATQKPKDSPPTDIYSSNGQHLRLARKVETIYPTPRHYGSSPALNNQTFDRGTRPSKHSTLYHLQSVDAY